MSVFWKSDIPHQEQKPANPVFSMVWGILHRGPGLPGTRELPFKQGVRSSNLRRVTNQKEQPLGCSFWFYGRMWSNSGHHRHPRAVAAPAASEWGHLVVCGADLRSSNLRRVTKTLENTTFSRVFAIFWNWLGALNFLPKIRIGRCFYAVFWSGFPDFGVYPFKSYPRQLCCCQFCYNFFWFSCYFCNKINGLYWIISKNPLTFTL